MRRSAPVTLALAALLATACGHTAPTPPPPPAPPIDAGIEEPDTGYWTRNAPGAWDLDLGLGLRSDVQLSATPPGAGLLHVSLPPGASTAVVTTLAVTYARNATEMSDDGQDPSAAGEATWTFYEDVDGAPGAELTHLDVTVDAATAIPLGDGGEPIRHPVPGLRVGPTFWLGFSVRSGDPRVAAMRVNFPDGVQFADLYYRFTPDGPLGAPVNARPYLGLTFTDLAP